MQNEKLFTQWVDEHSDVLYGYAVKHGLESEAARDILQDTFLAAWRNMEGYRGEASVKNWLFVILKSKITDYYRKASNKVEIESLQYEDTNSGFFDADDHWSKGFYPKQWNVNFSSQVETKEFYKIFKGCSNKLKQIQNAVFVMKYVDGLQSEEICKVFNISASNYWVLIHRAKVQLRACLEKNWITK